MTSRTLAGYQASSITPTHHTSNAVRKGGFFIGISAPMFKKLFLSLALTFGLLSSSFAAGTIPFSLSQQLDNFGKPLAGCLFYTIQAGTTSTPQNAFQDSALTIPLPNPQTCDAAGRLPQMFVADGSIKVRLTDKNGVTVIVADNIQVIGNSSGGGGGSPVDPTTILTTGDIKATYGTGVISGFVRFNGRTIGSATSGATERANADVQALFVYLWSADPNLVVSTGRGASAGADWAANKQITLPDASGRVLANVDASGSILTSFSMTPDGSTLGAKGGAQAHTLTLAEMPAHSHGVNDPGHTHGISASQASSTTSGTLLYRGSVNGGTFNITVDNAVTGISIQNNGGGGAHAIVQPTIIITYYIKL